MHNHPTRIILKPGTCPGCDQYHQSRIYALGGVHNHDEPGFTSDCPCCMNYIAAWDTTNPWTTI